MLWGPFRTLVCAIRDLKATAGQVPGEEIHEAKKFLLVPRLQEKCGVGWNILSLYTLEPFEDIIFGA